MNITNDWIEQLYIYIKEQLEMQTKLNFMTIQEYQEIIKKTAVFPKEIALAYCSLGLVDELGEYVEKVLNRDDLREREKEAGDVFWYITALGNELGITLEELIESKTEYYFDNSFNKEITKLFIIGSKIQGKVKKYIEMIVSINQNSLSY